MTLNRSFFAFCLAFFSLCVFAGAVAWLLWPADDRVAPGVTALVTLVLATSLLRPEGRRDPDAVLTFLGVFALLNALVLGIYCFSADSPGVVPKASAVVVGAAALAMGYATFRRQRAGSTDFPDVLAAHFRPESVFETEGIQFTGHLLTGANRAPHQLRIFLQNCFDGPRWVTIRLDASPFADRVRCQPHLQVAIGPAEVSQATFPVITPASPGQYAIYISIAVTGSTGRRVRLRRGQVATERTSAVASAAFLAVGHLKFGGGVRITVGPLPDDLSAMSLPDARLETAWRPRLGTVPLQQSVGLTAKESA